MPTGSVTPAGGGGPAAGTYLPVADTTGGVTVSTALADPLGGGHTIKTLVFPAEQNVLSFAQVGDTRPRIAISSDPTDVGILLGDGSSAFFGEVSLAGGQLSLSGVNNAAVFGPTATHSYTYPQLGQLSPKFTITSGALSTVQLVSATGAQILTDRDAETITPCTFNPGAATTATVTVALSPDNVTYSTLGVETEPAGVAFDGTIHLVKVRVPAGWYLKLTANAQAVLGLTTYY